jgi:hypothetical protein
MGTTGLGPLLFKKQGCPLLVEAFEDHFGEKIFISFSILSKA